MRTSAFTHRSLHAKEPITQRTFIDQSEATGRPLYTVKTLLHMPVLKPRRFHTRQLRFDTRTHMLLRKDAFAQRCFCIDKLLQTDALTHRSFYKEKPFVTERQAATKTSFYTQTRKAQKHLHA